MCGRFTLRTPTPVLIRTFRLESAPELTPRYNVAPTQSIAVVRRQQAAEARELVMMHWGLIPSWARDPSIGNRMINARGETVAEKPSFRAAFGKRRCLILADGYYEWEKREDGKQPYWIRMRDGAPFGMAGLWESWRPRTEGDAAARLESCTIITTAANELTRGVHDRMPVILEEQDWDLWLDPAFSDTDTLMRLLAPHASAAMEMSPVSRHVNNARHEDPGCLTALVD